jgi:hypothetical protein
MPAWGLGESRVNPGVALITSSNSIQILEMDGQFILMSYAHDMGVFERRCSPRGGKAGSQRSRIENKNKRE